MNVYPAFGAPLRRISPTERVIRGVNSLGSCRAQLDGGRPKRPTLVPSIKKYKSDVCIVPSYGVALSKTGSGALKLENIIRSARYSRMRHTEK